MIYAPGFPGPADLLRLAFTCLAQLAIAWNPGFPNAAYLPRLAQTCQSQLAITWNPGFPVAAYLHNLPSRISRRRLLASTCSNSPLLA